MFEQSYYNFEEPEPRQLEEGEFLYNYELKSWNFTPRLYKIIAMSAALNLVALMIFGQTSLLTMKGCDSPLVNRVCQVLDTVYIGSVLFGTDREYVDQAYEKTELADADITYVDVSDATPPLTYPEGYFALANPEQYAMLQQGNNPMAGFTGPIATNPSPQDDLRNTTPIIPQENPHAVIGGIPSSPLANVPGASARKANRGGRLTAPAANNESPDKLPDVDGKTANTNANSNSNTQTDAQVTADKVPELEVNKKPLLDFADTVLTKWSNHEVDLSQPFTVVLDATLTADGKFDTTKTRWDVTKQKGDQKMIDVAKDAVEAVGDSGFLSYLRKPPFDVEKLTITLVQDDDQIMAVISSNQKTAERARTKSSQLNNAITIGKTVLRNPSDERTLLDGAKVTAEGSNFVINFNIPKPVAQELINKKLNEARAKKVQGQPSGSADSKPSRHVAKL